MIIKSLALLALFLSSTTFGARIRQAPDVSEDPPIPKGFEIEKRDVQDELKKVKEGKELETTSMIDDVQGDIRGRGAYGTVIYPLKAVCVVEQPTSGSNDAREKPRGTLTFTQKTGSSGLDISINLSGLKPFSKHGLHIHQTGDIREACNATGPHYNPLDRPHGSRDSEIRHLGDLGNIEANMNGNVVTDFTEVKDLELLGPFSILGRACVIHKNEDDLGLGMNEGSKTNGNSGTRIGCGVVGWL